MSPSSRYQDQEFDYSADTDRETREKINQPAKSPRYARRGKTPQSFNGIHRRRKKRWQW